MTDPSAAARKMWNYTPPLPITQAPYVEKPFNLKKSIAYFLWVWSPLSLRFYILLAAFAIWTWFTPSLDRAVTFSPDWMGEILLRNYVLVVTLAGGLHLWLFTFRKQKDELRFDDRGPGNQSKFHFGSQVKDNMFWTLASAVPVGTAFECLILWAYANGYATLITFDAHPVWFIALFVLIPLWTGFYFYWQHRLLHVEPLYRWVHSWHHKNVNTGPWSGHSMHPVEHIVLYADTLPYLILPSHPVHLIFNLMMHTIDGPVSHCGYEKLKVGGNVAVQVGDFMHQLHHRFYDCNYGTYETPWDKIFGSFHDGTAEGDRMIAERRRRLGARRRPTRKARAAAT